MKFIIFVAVAMFAALTGDASSTSTAATSSAIPGTTAKDPAKSPTLVTTKETATTVTTTPKPLSICKNGTCSGNTTCYNTTTFNGTVTCGTGNICAVHEHKVNETFSNYKLSCDAKEICEKAESEGTAACCGTDNCVPDLKAAKAKAEENEKKSGCDTVRLNLNSVVSMAFMLIIIQQFNSL